MDRDEEFDRRLFLVAQLYYEQNLTQKDISLKLNVPQPTVSRWLEEARKANWLKVRIEADRPYGLEKSLCDDFQLRECRVAVTHEHMTESDMATRLGQECARYLVHLLTAEPEFQERELRLGLSGGTTLSTMIHQMPLKTVRRWPTHLLPALGFLSSEREIRFVNGVVIVAELLDRIQNSTAYWLPLPPWYTANLPPDELEQRRRLLRFTVRQTPLVRNLMRDLNTGLDVLFTGMGAIIRDHEKKIIPDAPAGHHFITFARKVDPHWLAKLETAGVIGDLSFLPFNEQGFVPMRSLRLARVGIAWRAFRSMVERNKRVVLVCGGVAKHDTLFKLLTCNRLRRTVNVLITDVAAARYLQRRFKLEYPKGLPGAGQE